MTIFEHDGAEAWSILHRSLTQMAGGEPRGAVIQPLGTAERADWDTNNQPLNWYRELRIANQVPTWNPLYIPSSGDSVPDEYQAFLDQLNSDVISASGAADRRALRRADRDRHNAQVRMARNEGHINNQWDRYFASHGGNPPLSRPQ